MSQIALGANEQIIYQRSYHWLFFWPVVWQVLLVAALFFGIYVQVPGLFGWLPFKVLSALAVLWLTGGVLLHVIDFFSACFVLTNKRLIFRQGWWQRSTLDVLLVSIESVEVAQSVIGRLLGYGTLVIHGTGGSHDPLYFLPEPLVFRHQVQMQIDNLVRGH